MTERLPQRLRLALDILAQHPGGLPQEKLWQRLVEQFPLNTYERQRTSVGTSCGRHAFTTHTAWLVKAGWLSKGQDLWYVTGVGRKALTDHSDPQDFFAALAAAYRYWVRYRDRFTRAQRLVEKIPYGRWVAVTDVAAIAGLDPDRLVARLQGGISRGVVPGPRPGRLTAQCRVPERARAATLVPPARKRGCDGPPRPGGPMRRVDPEDLRQLAAEEPGEEPAGPCAWLVRGSSVHGYNLVPWLKKGYCSLSAARLRELPAATAAVLATSGIVKVTPGSRSGL